MFAASRLRGRLGSKSTSRLYQTTGGDIRVVEQRLGLNPGDFDNVQVAVIERPNVQIPAGKELGANANWIPGGYTSGGIPEAVIPGQLKTDQVKVISMAELFNGN